MCHLLSAHSLVAVEKRKCCRHVTVREAANGLSRGANCCIRGIACVLKQAPSLYSDVEGVRDQMDQHQMFSVTPAVQGSSLRTVIFPPANCDCDDPTTAARRQVISPPRRDTGTRSLTTTTAHHGRLRDRGRAVQPPAQADAQPRPPSHLPAAQLLRRRG